jgi:histidine triad (HIT) family protein
MRTSSPGRNPNSASLLPKSGVRESAAETETTRAEAPGLRSISGMLWADMDAILHENSSHYYYRVTFQASRIDIASESLTARHFLIVLLSLDPSEAYEMPTLFEKIIAGELPATVLYRDPRVIAFLDIRPAAPVHILIVPNKPIATANDIADDDESLIGHMFIVARDLARQQGIAESGYRLIINCNAHGGQEVYHLHVHLLGGRPLGPMVARA